MELDVGPAGEAFAIAVDAWSEIRTELRSAAGGDFPGTGKMFRDPKQSANMGFGVEYLFQFVHHEEVLDLPVNYSGTPVTQVINKPTS